mmetsp:Transcript_9614/g.30882  ORF Transcript_9614/g.30882 Transcript_9614/m.30882 type:complete len:113 (+) Transcript_9614:449-787(+)
MASFASLPPKGLPPRPPDKGSFPLDHFRECSDVKAEYMECLKLNGMKAEACKKLSGSYLKCRMERKLMAEEELSRLGFHEVEAANKAPLPEASESDMHQRKKAGFIAGVPRR